MGKCYCYELPNGRAAIIHLPPGVDPARIDYILQKTCFEATRDPSSPASMAEHFNPDNPLHLARGNTLPLYEVDTADCPIDRITRNNWVLTRVGNRNIIRTRPL